MADNFQVTAGSGTTVATRNEAGVHFPKQLMTFDVGGTSTLVSSSAPLPVVQTGTPGLPSGASTSAKQPALGTAGTASADVITVQGIASMTALKTDGSATTQPVSGTFWQTTQPVSGTFWQATQPVSGTFWQATQPVSGTITANAGTNLNTSALALDATLTGGNAQVQGNKASGATDAGNPVKAGGVYNSSAPTLTTGQRGDLQIDANGNLKIAIVSGGGSGGTASSFGSAFPATGTAMGASDGTNMKNLKVDGSQNLNVNLQTALPAGTNAIGTIQPGNTANTTPWLVTAYDKQVTVNASYTRPANTTTYAAGQVLANSTSAATILTFASAVRANGSGGRITEAILRDGANQTLKLEAELWLFSTSITMQNDGAAFAPTNANVDNLLQIITFSAGSARVGNAAAGISGNVACHGLFQNNGYFVAAGGDTSIYGVLVVRNAYVPVSAETFKVILTIEQDT